ncbi:NAD(P)H-hydrate dehydratase [Nakamurella endophytica]|uniref:Bifunctional NAD(P)H-hydrate repair enzyme n=1 Tax=Nakamurella endophytica TaxID=1748367 RepID=A0A917SXT7_9ACTN|nr:NAD(P)H-hydrate dehydratase [Nakamurella endophytica]GGM03057.1 bifunctional NAD(P)H-hydrate repair enzyme Nnr [Nakamurella endophytica]
MLHAWTVEQIRAAESAALARTGDQELMRRAAGHVAWAVCDRLDPVTGAEAVLLVGAGNNGGDALHAGALLRRRGMAVTAVLLDPGRAHAGGLAAFRARRGRVLAVDGAGGGAVAGVLERADVVVDGIVGIGARGPLRPDAARWVDLVPAAALRVAVDVPSGLDPDTGTHAGPVFTADVTVTVGGLKPGLLLADDVAGTVLVADVGFAPKPADARVEVLTDLDVEALLPDPRTGSDKYTGGVPGIVAGSAQYPGAALLCVGGAVRVRPGMVRYAGPQAAAVVARWPEVVAGDDPSRAGQVQAWVAGPGMGTDEAALDRLRTVVDADAPVLVDADGLTLLARHPELLAARRDRPTVLTPHEREFARIFPDLDLADRLGAVRRAAALAGVTVLLKGHRTLVAEPGGTVTVNTTGSGWLATAGSGDVLSGVIGSLLAAGLSPATAAAAGAHLHGRAGERAAALRAAGAHQLWDLLRVPVQR